MSLIVTVYVPSVILMASDSRQTISVQKTDPQGNMSPPIPIVSSDFAYKTFLLDRQQVGISNFGEAFLGRIPTDAHLKQFEEEILSDRDDVESVASKMLNFFKSKFPEADTSFHIAGYKKRGKISEPYIYHVNIKRSELMRLNFRKEQNQITYGASWGGEGDIVLEILNPIWVKDAKGNYVEVQKPPIPWDAMPIQDAIDFSIYAIKTTIDTMRFQARPKTVGGPIDVLLITPEGARWIRRKELG